ncbi:hypothetical protein [Amycolatopsis sp. H20-H5]|uniref:hypothetical protein n=1 Tax=Amycolatopsis sp. H20-H5 TaxID=3046309 RepID=UPI002DB7EEE1|nr:hypothetical protein [Amycolatopsis sp. H20-H5]MEC3979000.1 hypothetical protein [Amycolatopsis sp. H20-H5]
MTLLVEEDVTTRLVRSGRPDVNPLSATLTDDLSTLRATARLGLRQLETRLTGRHPVRGFSDRPISLGELRLTIERAHKLLQPDRRPETAVTAKAKTLVAAYNVTGLPRGLYSFGENKISSTGPDSRTSLPALKTACVEAPALILVCCDFLSATDPVPFGDLLTAAGNSGYALWLAARFMELGCVVRGSSMARATEAARKLSPGLRHMLTVAIGHERTVRSRKA